MCGFPWAASAATTSKSRVAIHLASSMLSRKRRLQAGLPALQLALQGWLPKQHPFLSVMTHHASQGTRAWQQNTTAGQQTLHSLHLPCQNDGLQVCPYIDRIRHQYHKDTLLLQAYKSGVPQSPSSIKLVLQNNLLQRDEVKLCPTCASSTRWTAFVPLSAT